jgi:hypothetical protein
MSMIAIRLLFFLLSNLLRISIKFSLNWSLDTYVTAEFYFSSYIRLASKSNVCFQSSFIDRTI